MTSLDADSLELLEDGLRKAMLSASGMRARVVVESGSTGCSRTVLA